jgi:serine/threonine protein kinase
MSVVSVQTLEYRQPSTPSDDGDAGDAGDALLFNQGAVIDGKYEIVRPIGRGGMGRVVEIRRLSDGRRLALKYAPGRVLSRRRLIREARILSALRHPHLLPVLDAGLDRDPPYLVMPLAAGSLDAEIPRRAGDLPWALEVFRQVCQGVQALHRAAVVHRDLKPANILRLTGGAYAVADLGAAKREPRDSTVLTRTCAVLGTLHYLAPEQLMPEGSRRADARTDVYQLGKILYQLVTGRSPAVVDPDRLPRGLAHIVRRATATRPDDRYPDVAALLESVERCRQAADGSAADGGSGDDLLEVLTLADRLPPGDVLDAFDSVPVGVLARLGKESGGRLRSLLRLYCRCLESASGRKGFEYADLVARRMRGLIAAAPTPGTVAPAIEAILIVAVALNRYSAMAELRQALYQVRDVEHALAVAEMLRERREYFQEIAPELRTGRLHPILRGVVDDLDWIQTVSF